MGPKCPPHFASPETHNVLQVYYSADFPVKGNKRSSKRSKPLALTQDKAMYEVLFSEDCFEN